MAWRRFFFDPEKKNGDLIQLSEDESVHIRTVLRLTSGEQVELFDGKGTIYLAELVELEKRVVAKIVSKKNIDESKKTSLWLGQALLKGKKLDDVIPACTELGVSHFAPFQSSRCQGRLDGVRAAKKRERWERIVESSCKQCGRPVPMQVDDIENFKQLIEGLGPKQANELRIFFWEEERQTMLHDLDFSVQYDVIRIILGPEGGFTEDEAHLVKSNGWTSVSLGEMVLKADTATVTAVSLSQYLAGNLS